MYVSLIVSVIKVLNRADCRILINIITIVLCDCDGCRFTIIIVYAACNCELSRISVVTISGWASCIYIQVSIWRYRYSIIKINICWILLLNTTLVKWTWCLPPRYTICVICVINKIVICVLIRLFINSIHNYLRCCSINSKCRATACLLTSCM